eukprot:5298145-Prymnesium_polylepis.2
MSPSSQRRTHTHRRRRRRRRAHTAAAERTPAPPSAPHRPPAAPEHAAVTVRASRLARQLSSDGVRVGACAASQRPLPHDGAPLPPPASARAKG